MNNKLQKYDNYKHSNVEWLGEIPQHWEVKRIKSISRVKRGASPRPIDDPRYFNEDGEFSWVRIADVTANNHYLTSTVQKLSKLGASLSVKIYPNELFISIAGTVGKPMISKIKCCIHDGFVYFPDNKFNQEFLYRIFETGQPYLGLGKFGTQLNLNTETVGEIRIPYPPLSEQEKIAQFLDEKTTKIDKAIEIKQRQIELLKERRQILIHRAVTRGLDANVPLRDSGVEWIGEIPEHWEVKKLKYILHERNERSITGEEPLFMMSQIHGLVVRSDFHEKAEAALSSVGNKLVYEKDLVFNKLKAHLGVFFKSNIPQTGIVSPDYAVYYTNGIIEDVKFLEVLFRSPSYIREFICRATGIVEGLIRLYTGDLFDIAVPVPPKQEQRMILTHIENISAKISKAIGLKEREIEVLKEYKSSLINSAVTGKVRVF